MSNTIFCNKLQRDEPALAQAPYPGELGERILQNFSQTAWNMWLEHQTMLINEGRLNLMEKSSREFLQQEMEKFFFGDGSAKPAGYTPQT